ncbi:pAP2 family protein [Firmicutes bacterium CAG:884]|nr:pAP2 family protein [Firmicutes bacterium CAG:884]
MKRRIVCIISFILFLVTVILITNDNKYFDNYIINLFKYKSDILTNIMKIITFLGSALSIILLTVLLIIVVKGKRNKILILINVIVTTLLNQLLKNVFQRGRPIDSIIEESGYSFPSGHSMVSMAFYGFLIYLVYKSNIKYKGLIVGLLSVLIVLIGISRIYLGVHYPTDVIGGFTLSLSYLLLFIDITKPNFTYVN